MMRYLFDKEQRTSYILSRVTLSALISFSFLLLVYKSCGIWFETNDDVFISELLAGKITGQPEYHITYISTMVTAPIARLYSAFPSIPWWGLSILFHLFCIVALIVYSVIYHAVTPLQLLSGLVLAAGTMLSGLHIFAQAQFTPTAMMLALTGFVILLSFQAENKLSVLVFAICEIMACGLRSSSMLIVQPIGLAFTGGYLLTIYNFREKEGRNKIFRLAVIYVCVFVLSLGLNVSASMISYRDEQWKQYKQYDSAQIYFIDYETAIPYAALEPFAPNFSEEDYIHFLQYHHYYPNMGATAKCIAELEPQLKEIRKAAEVNPNFGIAIRELLFTSSQFWHLHQITLTLLLAGALLLLFRKQWNYLLVLGCGLSGYLIGLIALAYRNRFVLRVMMPYYTGAIILTSVFLFLVRVNRCGTGTGKRTIHPEWIVCMLIFTGVALQTGRMQFSYVRRQNNFVLKQYYNSLTEIIEYCNSHPDRHFVIDLDFARNCSTDVLNNSFYDHANYIYSGTWFSGAPSMIKYGTAYLNRPFFYYFVYEASEWMGREGLAYYAKCAGGSEPELTEKFKLSNGATIWVYRIEKNTEVTP